MTVASAAFRSASLALLVLLAVPAHAILTCDLDGQPVNPNNGATTAGRSGLMRCRDADTGFVQREQELKNGVFMGAERFFAKGELVKERRVNEKGNGDGPTREWTIANGKRVLVREGTDRNGSTVGLVRTWNPGGTRRRLTWYGDDSREEASVEFNDDGKPSSLRCAAKPVFGSDFDDRSACGFAGPTTTVLFDNKGRPRGRITFDQGQRRKTEQLSPEGTVVETREVSATGVVEASFYPTGAKRREIRYTNLPRRPDAPPTTSPPSVKTLEQDYAESGKLVHERRWVVGEHAADLVEESAWYLNGQPKTETRIASGPQGQVRREKTYFDNGALQFEGVWVTVAREGTRFGGREDRPVGTHRTFTENGRKQGETVYDDKGRLTRERAFDDSGAVIRDDEVFEDGSRKAVGR